MPSFNSLPTEILIIIIRSIRRIPEQLFETELLLLNRALCNLLMIEQIQNISLSEKKLNCFVKTVSNCDIKRQGLTPRYCDFLDNINSISIGHDATEESCKMISNIIRSCTGLRKLSIYAYDLIASTLEEIFRNLPLNIMVIELIRYNMKNEYLTDYLRKNNKIKELYICIENINRNEMCDIFECLKQNSSINLLEVKLRGNKLETDTLGDFLRQNSTLTDLGLHYCQISNDEVKSLADCLKQNPVITKLSFTSNGIGPQGAYALSNYLKQNSTITYFTLCKNKIGSDGARALADCLKYNSTLTELELNGNKIGPQGACTLADCLKQNSTLTSLDLAYNEIGNDGVNFLANSLKHNSKLTRLILSKNKISCHGACVLADCLKQNSYLTDLKLNENKIGIDGVNSIADCLKQNSVLTLLGLHYNNFGDEGALALADGLKQNSTITELYVDVNHHSREARVLADCMISNPNLSIILPGKMPLKEPSLRKLASLWIMDVA